MTGANTFTATLTGSGSPTSLYFQGVANSSGENIIYVSQSTSASVRIADTAKALVKAINRDTSAVVYAEYTSGADDVPGRIRFQAKGFTGAISIRASSTTAGTGFSPVLPDSFASGTQVTSENDQIPHGFFSSKQGEHEAVPLVNIFPAGAKNSAILRIAALRDSLIIVKEDGVFRMTGDNVNNFTVTPLDTTVFAVAKKSLDVINNEVIFLANQGVCSVTENSVSIISRNIEDVIQPILGQTAIDAETAAVAHESDRLYLLSTTEPNTTEKSITWAYNIQTNEWTEWDTLFISGVVGPKDTLYYIGTDGRIYRQRRKQTRLDYCGQNYACTVSAITDTVATILMPASVFPEPGDIIVKNDVISRIVTVENVGTNLYEVTFARQTNLEAADSVTLYSRFIAEIKFAPFHAGQVGRTKQFAQMQLHFRGDEASRLELYFTGQTYNGSESVDWSTTVVRGGR